jgi:hypothetical protein
MHVEISFDVPSSTGVDYDPVALQAWLAEQTKDIRGNRFVENWKAVTRYEQG